MCVLKNCFAKVPLGLRRVVREHTVVGLHRCLYRHFVSSVAHAELLMHMDDRFSLIGFLSLGIVSIDTRSLVTDCCML